ncbi:MAG: EamA family transporter [Steroidobacteraceae bacterium]|nr:EamA family transporter [Steroidobacteraceae bacterium]
MAASRCHAAGARLSQVQPPPARLALALAAVYLLWGSSYLATKVMVTDLPPLVAAGLRFSAAGLLLLAFAWWHAGPPVLERSELRHLGIMGLLSVAFSNACNVIAMQHVQSNMSALLNATPSLWIAWLGSMGARGSPLTRTMRAGLAIGLVGVVFVLSPARGWDFGALGWQLLILVACLSWSLGTIYYRHAGSRNPPLMFTALMMLTGGLGLLAAAAVAGESFDPQWTRRGFVAFAWLTVMSSCIAYSAYSWLAVNTTPAVTGSYGYVNPAIAALLGWIVLAERLSWLQIAGMVVILVGTALVTGYWRPLPRRQVV